MASFHGKIGSGRLRKRENKNYRSVQTRNIKFQKNSRTIQKIKKISLFQAIIGWKRLRKRENKNYRSVQFLAEGLKIPLWLHFRPKFVGKCREREKIKIVIPFCSVPTQR